MTRDGCRVAARRLSGTHVMDVVRFEDEWNRNWCRARTDLGNMVEFESGTAFSVEIPAIWQAVVFADHDLCTQPVSCLSKLRTDTDLTDWPPSGSFVTANCSSLCFWNAGFSFERRE